MKISTLVELAGFACLTVAAFMVHVIAGFVTAGVCLLFIGYAVEDQAAALAVGRLAAPVRAARARRRSRRESRKG